MTSVTIHQGEILKVENISWPLLVVSKDFFNSSEEALVCPVFSSGQDSPLHIEINAPGIWGYVHCEKLKLLDLKVRGFRKISVLDFPQLMDISDAIQGLFDYI